MKEKIKTILTVIAVIIVFIVAIPRFIIVGIPRFIGLYIRYYLYIIIGRKTSITLLKGEDEVEEEIEENTDEKDFFHRLDQRASNLFIGYLFIIAIIVILKLIL